MDLVFGFMPNECECGSTEFSYTTTKTVYISTDDDNPRVGGITEDVSNVKCEHCARVWLDTSGYLPEALVDELIDA